MPMFEYICPHCGKKFEELVRSHEEEVHCPDCKSSVNRVWSGEIHSATGVKKNNCSGKCGTCGGCG